MAIATPAAQLVPGFIPKTPPVSFSKGNIGIVNTQANAQDNVFVPLEPYPALQVTIDNNTGVSIQYARSADNETNYRTIANNTSLTIQGINNANQIFVRRADFNGAKPSVAITYEALL